MEVVNSVEAEEETFLTCDKGDPSDDLDRSLGDQVIAGIAVLPSCMT